MIDGLLALDPIAGTQLGFSGLHNRLMPPVDLAGRLELAREIERVATTLVNEYQDVRSNEGLDAAVAAAGSRSMVLAEESLRALEINPGWYVSSGLNSLYALLVRRDLAQDERNESAFARLCALPAHLQAARRNLNRPAGILVENAIGDTKGAIAFCGGELRHELIATSSTRAGQEIERAIDDALGALADYERFLKTVRTADGGFAPGRDVFDALLRDVHLLPFDSAELLSRGRDWVSTISGELASSAQQSFGTRDWWEPVALLSESLPAPGDLLNAYRDILGAVRSFVGDRGLLDLSTVPPVDVVATPTFARTNLPFAAYVGAPPFGSGRAEFWITPVDNAQSVAEQQRALGQHHLGRMLVACIHEAFPGHHVEFSLAHAVRRPLRHLFRSTIYTEGWAFYCERLIGQSGFLDRYPQAAAIRLAFERDQLWRALRIVIDIGLHCQNMTPSAAASLLADSHVMTRASAEAEVSYYCSAPTQPLSYMVGRRLFEDLLDTMKGHPSHAGKALRELHMEILGHGPVPLGLLSQHLGLNGFEA
jgi:hypothetical protein